jgi:hypothetical protein
LNHHTEQRLKALSNKVKDHRMRIRLLAVAHFKAGKNKADVARTLAEGWLMNGLPTTLKGVLAPFKIKNHREDPLYCLPSKKPSCSITSRNKVSLQVEDV